MVKAEMKIHRIKYTNLFLAGGFLLIIMGLLFPVYTNMMWFNVILKIREAINTGDSGHLILASAMINFLYAVQSTLLFMGTMVVIFYSDIKLMLKAIDIFLLSLFMIILLHWTNSLIFDMPWEPLSTITALFITLFLFWKLFGETNSFIQVFIVSIQVFFAFHWLNIMPFFTLYRFGQSDINHSIKIAGIYLNGDTVLNFTGFAFFMPFIISAFITATLFISYSRNINIMRENYEKENEIRNMKSKALENRVYQEVKSLVHDLKTPLVTIRGLNSLLLTSNENTKLEEYSERIENSVTKMSEMISSFLYESSRQRLKAADLISYIRAQLPLENEEIEFSFAMDVNLPDIYVNKIRVARAVINIFENAIVVPCIHQRKMINVEVREKEKGICIIVQDNGTGISENELQRIWEVGYSTNNTSGLGLPFAKGIIEDNKGEIQIESRQGEGTKVTILLPGYDNINGKV